MKDMPYYALPHEKPPIEAHILHKHTSREVIIQPIRQATKQVEKLTLRRIPLSCTCSLKLKQCDGNCLQFPLMLLLLFFCLPAFSQFPALYQEYVDTNCHQIYTLDDPDTPTAYILNEEQCIVGTDTFEGFWGERRFFVPDRGIALTFWDCGITFDYVPILKQDLDIVSLESMSDYHWSMAAQFTGLVTTIISQYPAGKAEGLLTTEARQRVEDGVHIRSSQSHTFRNQAMAGTALGLLTMGIGCYEYERQLRLHAPRKGFWYSTAFWPTIGRNALFLTSAVVGGHYMAQLGYNSEVKNP